MQKVIASLLVAGIGVASLGFGVRNYRTQQRAIGNSASVRGTVTAVEIEERSRDTTTYYPRVEYEYLGESYTGDSLYPGSLDRGRDTEDEAREVIDEFEEGRPLSLYVNKDDPSQSFAFRETTTFRNAGAIVAGLLFLVFGVWMLSQ